MSHPIRVPPKPRLVAMGDARRSLRELGEHQEPYTGRLLLRYADRERIVAVEAGQVLGLPDGLDGVERIEYLD